VPVVTLPGTRLPSRVSSAFMSWIDPSLIATNLLEYEDIVVKLATDASALQSAKEKVAKGVKISHLFDTHEWARSLKRASMLMWEVNSASCTPSHCTLMFIRVWSCVCCCGVDHCNVARLPSSLTASYSSHALTHTLTRAPSRFTANRCRLTTSSSRRSCV
jgi:hypothetical protein